MSSIKPPKKFVNLHSHTHGSVGDAIGTPQEHIDSAIENGMDAMAITDHGNMNAFSHLYLHAEKLKKEGKKFKVLNGIEAYMVPSLKAWKSLYESIQKKKEEERVEKKKKQGDEKIAGLINKIASGKKEIIVDEETQGGTQVEDESESKKKRTINPLYHRNHLVLLPKNAKGLKALFSCVSYSFIEGFYRYPRMDFELLEKHAKGNFIGLSGCIGGPLARIVFDNQVEENFDLWIPNDCNYEKIQKEMAEEVARFQKVLGKENFYLEMQFNKIPQQHLVNMHLLECAKRTGTPLVVTCDSHYSRPDHWREREIYKTMARQTFFKDKNAIPELPKSINELQCELYPKNAEQLWNAYLETTKKYNFYDNDIVREAIERTHTIAHEQIGKDALDIDKKVKLPGIQKIVDKNELDKLYKKFGRSTNEDDIAFQQLKKEVIKGARWRGIAEEDKYIERLKMELEVVKHLKFSKYFLTYQKIMKLIGEQCLTGPGRGSAGASLIAYALDITQLDPIKYDLLFARFLNKKKKGWVDIDSDVSDRERALEILNEYFGEENVVAISNFNQLQMRSLVKDICRINGVPFAESNTVTKKIETETKIAARKEPGFDATQWFLTFEAAVNDSSTFRSLLVKYPEFEKTIKVLFKNNRNVSRHAGGVLITEDTKNQMPVIKSGGVLQTPWTEGANYRHLEPFGFLKFDILGLGTLRMFENCIRRILKKQGNQYPTFKQVKEWYYQNLHPDNNNLDDPKVYRHVYKNGNCAGIFQFVRPQVQQMIAKINPSCVEDIAAVTSLFRPGPLAIGSDKVFLHNRKNPKKVIYKHPLLKEVLGKTSGCILFQEQLSEIYHKLAGVPLDETDEVRKAFTKKEIATQKEAKKERQRLRKEFIKGCKKTNQISEKISSEIFNDLEKHVKYLFNKSHATLYATISYQCGWLLTHFPDEWIATYIDYCINDKGKVTGYDDPKVVALGEARALGYKIGGVDINLSSGEFEVKNDTLVPSFGSLKSVGTVALTEIEQFRPYKTVEDLLWNSNGTWRHSKLNKRAMATLIKLGAFDSLDIVGKGKQFENYRQLYYVLVENGDKLKRAISKKKQDHKEVLEKLVEEAQELSDWTSKEKIGFSKDLAGIVDMNMIITPEVRDYLENKAGIKSIDDWANEKSLYWAIIDNCKLATTKTGKKYCRVKLYGESGASQLCFMWNYNPYKDNLLPENSLVIGTFKKSNFGLSASFGKLEIF